MHQKILILEGAAHAPSRQAQVRRLADAEPGEGPEYLEAAPAADEITVDPAARGANTLHASETDGGLHRVLRGLAAVPSGDQETFLRHGDVAPLVSGAPAPSGAFDAADASVITRRVRGMVAAW